MKKQLNNKNIFWIISVVLIFVLSLLLVVFMPEITAWRLSIADKLIQKANTVENIDLKYSYLSQANIIGFRDPVANNALAKFWIDRGEYKKAIAVYKNNIKEPNYVALGLLALKAREYNLANNYFQTASRANATAESKAGEAIALYNLENINDGCNRSNSAIKLNLKSELASNAVLSCIILGGKQNDLVSQTDISTLSEREIGYKLVNSLVFNQGEKKLKAIAEKTAFDYLLLSRLLASRGEIDEAITMAEKGIEIDSSITLLYTQLIDLYKITNNYSQIEKYQNRVEQLKFVKYQ